MSASARPPLLGVVLAGGASRRMGQDKALLSFRGRTLVGWAAERLALAGLRVVVADRGRQLVPALASLEDRPGWDGPAAGLLGVADGYPAHALVALACDLPAVPSTLLAEIAERLGEADLVVPLPRGQAEPLAAGYGPRALAVLGGLAPGSGPRALLEQPGLCVVRLGDQELLAMGCVAESFANLNTPAEAAPWGVTESPGSGGGETAAQQKTPRATRGVDSEET
jgi:molybdopterin-guanine dinucleotide biosynthesis protein A